MKNTSPFKAAATICTAAFLLSSCIYEAPGDNFFRTLWESTADTPFGTVTMEFLCGEQVSVSASGCIGSFGMYSPSGSSAILDGLSLTGDGIEAVITHAARNGDALILCWHNVTAVSSSADAAVSGCPVTTSADGFVSGPGGSGSSSADAAASGCPVTTSADGFVSGSALLPSDGIIVMHRLSAYR